MFGIVAEFPRRKSDNISPYFRDENLAMLHLRCVIAQKTLFLPSFRRENTTIEVPHFHDENPVEFCVLCTMAYRQGFMLVYTACTNILVLASKPEPLNALNILMRVAYTRKPISLGDMDQNDHTAMIMHTILCEYTPIAIALSTYPLY